MGWHAATGLERTLFQGGDWGFGIGDSKEQEHPVFPVLCQCRHVPAFPNPQSRIPNPRLQRTHVPISSPRSTRSSTPGWPKIGRTSCRERVRQYVKILAVGVSSEKRKTEKSQSIKIT